MVTIPPQFSRELLGDKTLQAKKIGPDFADMRGDHLHELTAAEAVIRAAAPLPISYDVSRTQPPYFSEYTYTECLGSGLLVSPMSVEASARMVQMALDHPDQGFDAASAVLDQVQRRGTLDKYKLDAREAPTAKAVAFLPGSNIFREAVSLEALSRAMHDDDELVIKPHPMTGREAIGELCSRFGFGRVVVPSVSGHACLMVAERVYTVTTSEMGLYAVLMNKPVRNVGDFWNEGRGTYSAFYRPLWGHSVEDAKATLTHALNSPYGGYMHKDDPALADRVSTYFAGAMQVRAFLKPLIPTRPAGPPQPASGPK